MCSLRLLLLMCSHLPSHPAQRLREASTLKRLRELLSLSLSLSLARARARSLSLALSLSRTRARALSLSLPQAEPCWLRRLWPRPGHCTTHFTTHRNTFYYTGCEQRVPAGAEGSGRGAEGCGRKEVGSEREGKPGAPGARSSVFHADAQGWCGEFTRIILLLGLLLPRRLVA